MAVHAQPLASLLARHTREGELYGTLENDRVRCVACGHRCLIPPGREGICRVRFNEGGVLKVPFGYVAALHVDPVEKKPFFHALPGVARALVRHAGLRPPLRLLPELAHLADAARPERRSRRPRR